jgi:hypothetical protein
VAPNAKQNKLSYLVDYYMMARKRKVVNTFIKDRLATESAVFGVNVPEGIRSIAKQLGARRLQSVVRHKCVDCDYAWIGPIDPADFNLAESCPDCGHPRYMQTASGIKPVSIFWYFGLSNALGMLHSNPLFRAAYKNKMDLTINAFRNSSDARRLNEATGGEAFKPDNAFYVIYADAFRPNDSATQGVTGMVENIYHTCNVLTRSLIYTVGVGLSCLDLCDEAFGKKFNSQPIALIDSPEPSNTCKVLRELFIDLVRAHEFGIHLPKSTNPADGDYLHKVYCAQMWQDGVAR